MLAFDLSLRATGFALIIDNQLIHCDCIEIPDRKIRPMSVQDSEDIIKLSKNLFSLISTYDPSIIIYEDPAGSKSSRAIQTLAFAKAAFLGIATALNSNIFPVRAKQVKKVLTGDGNAKKEELAKIVEDKFPEFIDISNGWTKIRKEAVVDAIALYLYYETIKGE